MKTISKMLRAGLGFVLIGAFLAAMAAAQCGTPTAKLHKQAWRGGDPTALLAQAADGGERIVGMWHVNFTAKGNEAGPPDGTPIDNALVLWHSDRTEMMASDRPAQDGQICMGVWEKTGKLTYKLNHIPWLANDTANAPSGIGNPTGPVRLVQEITLSRDGTHYSGTFTLDAYDLSGNPIGHVVGVISATRITINTTVGDLL